MCRVSFLLLFIFGLICNGLENLTVVLVLLLQVVEPKRGIINKHLMKKVYLFGSYVDGGCLKLRCLAK
jgi:hypothetical protein